jgi:hypothetical protein
MSRFDRQPVDILIEIKARGQPGHDTHNTVNLSTGGLAFICDREFEPGGMVEIRIPFVNPPFEAKARIAWCTARGDQFEIGVEFQDQDDAFMTRMVEQVCHIVNYKQEILRTEGRLLSPEEAASEWISKYAARFPGSADAK